MTIKHLFHTVDEYFSPKIIGEVNDQYIKIAKIKGEEVPWHRHENEDELFYVVAGAMQMEIESQPAFTMTPGDLFVVKKGVNHRVSSTEECWIMLIESKTTEHTGNVTCAITKTIEEQKG